MTDRPDLAALPSVAAIDGLSAAALPAVALHLTALLGRVAARLATEGESAPHDEPMTLDDVAAYLHVTRKRVLELTREAGGLPRIEVSRKEILIRRSDLLAWEARRVVEPPTTLYSPPHS